LIGIIRWNWWLVLFLFLLYGPILFFTILIHELGHVKATFRLGGEVKHVIISPIGGLAICGPTDQGAWGEFIVSIAGPITHVFMMVFWVISYLIMSKPAMSGFYPPTLYFDVITKDFNGFILSLCKAGFWGNLILFVLNGFLTAYPFDGGRCLGALLIMYGFSTRKAAMSMSIIGFLWAIGLFVWGIIAIFKDEFDGIFLMIISLILAVNAKSLLDRIRSGRLANDPIFGRACFNEQETIHIQHGVDDPTLEDVEML
jgi:Zn-dependent protease